MVSQFESDETTMEMKGKEPEEHDHRDDDGGAADRRLTSDEEEFDPADDADLEQE